MSQCSMKTIVLIKTLCGLQDFSSLQICTLIVMNNGIVSHSLNIATLVSPLFSLSRFFHSPDIVLQQLDEGISQTRPQSVDMTQYSILILRNKRTHNVYFYIV
jgi:hypothetical protein